MVNNMLKDTNFVILNFWHSIIGFSLPFIVIGIYSWATKPEFFLAYTGLAYLWIFFGSICDTLTAVTCCIAFQYDSPSFIALLTYSTVAYAFFFDIFVFKQNITGLLLGCAIGILIITFSVAVIKYKYSSAKKEEKKHSPESDDF